MTHFVEVTELGGDEVTEEQVQRIFHRYVWSSTFSKQKDVLEVGCGTGQGLGYLLESSKTVEAGDYSEDILSIAREYYKDRINLKVFDAQNMPHSDNSKDVIILFEAIYYIPEVKRFINECRRVLRPGGIVLIATANKDLPDFNPSPHSFDYYGVHELNDIFSNNGFTCNFYGYLSVKDISIRQRILRPIKKLIVSMGLMPKTMSGKKFFKKLVFGSLVKMPFEIKGNEFDFDEPEKILDIEANKKYKVIYCSALILK